MAQAAQADSFADYATIQRLNWSTLRLVATSPLLAKYRVTHPQPDKRAFDVGRLIHVASLEPDRWRRDFAVEPDFGEQLTEAGKPAVNPKATKGYRRDLEQWTASLAPGVTIVSAADHELADTCAAAMRGHRVVGPLLEGGRAEQTITWTDPDTGVECKARTDLVTRGVVDIKSTRRQTVKRFLWDAEEYLYFGQAAWYHDGCIAAGLLPPDADGPFIIAVQNCEPFDTAAFHVPGVTLDAGRALYRSLLKRYVECQAANYWPGFAPDLLELDLSPRAYMDPDESDGDPW